MWIPTTPKSIFCYIEAEYLLQGNIFCAKKEPRPQNRVLSDKQLIFHMQMTNATAD